LEERELESVWGKEWGEEEYGWGMLPVVPAGRIYIVGDGSYYKWAPV
jgi:hypothetical protein